MVDPARRRFEFQTEVIQVVTETADVRTLRLAIPDDVPFTFLPGQFVNLTVDTPEYGPDKARLTRPYSIASSPTEGNFLDLTVQYYADGTVSKHLGEVSNVGEVMTVNGPHGTFCFKPGLAQSIALIGGDAGVAPMRSISKYIVDSDLDVQIHYLAGCRTPDDRLYPDAIAQWAQDAANLHVTYTMTHLADHPWHGRTGAIDGALLTEVCPPDTTELYYVAGPTAMVRAVRRVLKEDLGVDRKRIHWEPWG